MPHGPEESVHFDWHAIADGNQEATGKLLEYFYPLLTTNVARMSRIQHLDRYLIDPADIALDAITSLWHQLPDIASSFPQDTDDTERLSRVSKVALRLARNAFLDQAQRQTGRHPDTYSDEDLLLKPDLITNVRLESEVLALERAIASLPREDRRLLQSFSEGNNVREIARDLGEDANVVSMRLSRVLAEVREWILRERRYQAGRKADKSEP